MADVLPIKGHTAYERVERRAVARTLRMAREAKLSDVLVIGHKADGSLFVGSHPPDPGGVLWLMEMAKRKLLFPDMG